NSHVEQMSSAAVSKVIHGNRATISKRVIDDASTRFGMLCLSEKPDNILMWSHYSDGHRGMVIGLDTDLFREGGESFRVNYPENNERVEYKPFRSPGDSEFETYLKELPRTKGLNWAYEKEWRWLYTLDHQAVKVRQLSSGRVGYFLSIPGTAI